MSLFMNQQTSRLHLLKKFAQKLVRSVLAVQMLQHVALQVAQIDQLVLQVRHQISLR